MSMSDDSQTDLFANTQVETRNDHVTDEHPDKWMDTNFEYPWMIFFKWDGNMTPFAVLSLIELNPQDIDGKWLTGILSPKSRIKHRSLKFFADYSVSIFGKIHKSKCALFLFISIYFFKSLCFIRILN